MKTWDLKQIIRDITNNHNNILSIYLFGSRAYQTNSLRSDIDLLAICDSSQPVSLVLTQWIHTKYAPIDLFISYDKKTANSCVNGSAVSTKGKKGDLIEILDAILLWENNTFYDHSDDIWNQKTHDDSTFIMSIIPSQTISPSEMLKEAIQKLKDQEGIDVFYTGTTLYNIGKSICNIIADPFICPKNKYQLKAKNFSLNELKIKDEYDFQNLILLLLHPIFPDITPNPFEITIDNNKKNADFSIMQGKIVIEAKYINSTNKKDGVVKTLEGLNRFYQQNPNIQTLIFSILYEDTVNFDTCYWENYFREKNVIVKCIKNVFHKTNSSIV